MCLFFAILRRWKKAVLEVYMILELKDMSGSKTIPRFIVVVLEARAMPSGVNILLNYIFLRC